MRRIQLDFIDGLRALLALYIVAHHALQFLGVLPRALFGFGYGQAVVAVFVTVSGFCLALPQAISGQWTVDAGSFYLRRVRRILPPYYAALTLALLVALGFKWLGPFRDPTGEFSARAVWSHLLLVQNWVPGEMYTLNGPLWSIAVECQIYLLFPLLVMLRQKSSSLVMLVVTAVFSYAAFRLFHAAGQPQFLMFFAMGVVAAEFGTSKQLRRLTPAFAVIAAAGLLLMPHLSTLQQEGCASVASAALLAYLTQQEKSVVGAVLGWRPLAWVGIFSYSIYLMHDLFLAMAWYWIRNREPTFATEFNLHFLLVMLTVSFLAVIGSYAFHLVFERPFLSRKRQKAEQRLEPAGNVPG